jgi:hypothetical protein
MAPLAGAARWVLQPYRPVPGLPLDPGLRGPGEDELAELAERLRQRQGSRCSVRGGRAEGGGCRG